MNASQSKLMDDFYELCEIMEDDISDVSIVISHMMYMGGLVLPLTCVRRDCLSATVENLEKYSDFINDALDTPIKELRAICDKKLANTTQLRAKIKELQEELNRVKYEAKEHNLKKKKKKNVIIVSYMYIPPVSSIKGGKSPRSIFCAEPLFEE